MNKDRWMDGLMNESYGGNVCVMISICICLSIIVLNMIFFIYYYPVKKILCFLEYYCK